MLRPAGPWAASLPRRAARAMKANRWGLVVTGVALVAFLASFDIRAGAPGESDGRYMWAFARSLVFDHDIDFTNDYALCGDPHGRGHDFGTGHPANPFYVGPTVFWAPVLWIVRALIHFPADAPTKVKLACYGPLVTLTLAVGRIAGVGVVWMLYRIGRRFAADAPAAFAAALLGFTGTLPAYASIFTSYSHVYDTFWACVVVLATLRALERPEALQRWAWTGCAVGVGLLQRPTSAFHGILPLVMAVVTLRRAPWRLARALAAMGAGAFWFGLFPQMLVYRYLYGAILGGIGARGETMQYAHSHPFLVLFAPHGGLFFTMPAAWVAVAGLAWMARDRGSRPLSLALFATGACVVWLSGAISDWTSYGTFGARRLTSLLPILAPPAAVAVAGAARWLRARPGRATFALGVAVLAPWAFTMLGATHALIRGRLSTEVGPTQGQLYGEGEKVAWEFVDDTLGDLAILPAELLFHFRYGVPLTAFRDASEDIRPGPIDLTQGHHQNLVTGVSSTPEGMRLAKRRATIVFGIQSPHPKTCVLRGRASVPTRLRVGFGGWLGTRWWGEVTLDARAKDAQLEVPAGAFDSGIVEVVVERVDAAEGDVLLTGLEVQSVYP